MLQEYLSDPDGRFSAHYNRSTFMFPHGLSGHPLLQLPDLIDLADRLEKRNGCYWSNGAVNLTDRWEKGVDRRRSLRETMENIEENDSLVILKFGVHDPIVGPFFRDLLITIIRLAGPEMAEDVQVGRVNVLIASPHRITNYHIDSDVNFLLQVAGDKSFAVFDQNDRMLITDDELERYFSGDESAACFKLGREAEATAHELKAGFGVHVPCMAPHWARNGNQVSIALSCCFDLASIHRLGLVYKTNYRLRGLGFKPTSPRDGTWRNGAKMMGAKSLEAMRGLLRPRAPTHRGKSGWTPASKTSHPGLSRAVDGSTQND